MKYAYTILLKKGKEVEILAYSYTENSDSGRTYFHQLENQSDRESYVLTSEIAGILRAEMSVNVLSDLPPEALEWKA